MSRLRNLRQPFGIGVAAREMLGNNESDVRIVVVLQGDEAFWFKWLDQELLETHVEPVESEALGRHVPCPWIQVPPGEPQLPVRLVLDTSLDELDRVKAEGLSGSWTGAVQRHRLKRRVQAEYPLASVYDLPDYMMPDVLSVVHHVVPDHWEKWLLQLQTHDICITHVVTALELLCHWSTTCRSSQEVPGEVKPGGEPGLEAGVEPGFKSGIKPGISRSVDSDLMLINVRVAREQRHLLVDHGIPIFMRLAERSDFDCTQGESESHALTTTLNHVRDQVVRQDQHPAVVVPALPWPSPSEEFAAARVLAALCIGRAVNRQVIDAVGNVTTTTRECHPTFAAAALELTVTPAREPFFRWFSAAGHRTSINAAWRLSKGHRLASAALQVSVSRNRLRRRIMQLQKATLLCALMAVVTVTFAAVHGMASARERARLSGEQRLLGKQISHLSKAVLMLNAEPAIASRSIERIGSHDAVRPLEPKAILTRIAGAISDFPALAINSLSWSVVDGDTPTDTVLTSVARVDAREQLWSADSHRARIQLQLTGTIGVDLGLREQQLTLESFVDHLTSLPGIAQVSVLESPVSSARSSEHQLLDGSSYRLSMLLVSS